MDQTQLLELARQLVGYAGPLIAGGALAKLGENTTDTGLTWLKGAWGLLQRRFQGNKQADAALTIFEMEATQPANQERVAQQIVAVFQQDAAALQELRALIEELRRIQPLQRSHTQDISGNARVGTKIQAIAAHCQKLVVLLNCCYAGGTAGQVLSDQPASGAGPQLSAPPRDYVAALAPGGGRVVISSSRSEQPSAAVAEDDFSLTTFGSKLIKGLRGAAPGDGPAVGVLDLFAHLAATVPADARGIQLDQHPLLFASEVDQNFAVALRPVGQPRGTLDVAQPQDVQRLAQIEVALATLDRDEDAPDLLREREAIVRRLGAS